jgi:hypothetical protein
MPNALLLERFLSTCKEERERERERERAFWRLCGRFGGERDGQEKISLGYLSPTEIPQGRTVYDLLADCPLVISVTLTELRLFLVNFFFHLWTVRCPLVDYPPLISSAQSVLSCFYMF